VEFDAPSGLGRAYGRIAGDLNPIHVSDLSAKLFGFPHAIAHGMWSLARCAAEFDTARACALGVQFKLPVFLPSRVKLEVETGGEAFGLFDAKGERPHLAATLTALSRA
jgi:acyl dehydratase